MPSENYGATDFVLTTTESHGEATDLVDDAKSMTDSVAGSEDAKETPAKPEGQRLSPKQKLLLCLIVLTNFFHLSAFSLLAPFFPQEANVRGLSSTVTGLIFSTFMFVSFVISPVYGTYISTIGINFMFSAGLSVGGACALIFGVLQYCPTGSSFIVLCLLTRSLESLGLTAFSTASFTVVTSQFTGIVTTVFGSLETAKSVGFMLGPTLGGALYSVGGFGLPFYVTGACLLLNGLLLCALLPKTEYVPEKCIPEETKKAKFRMLRSCQLCLSLASVCLNCLSIGFIDANFALYLEHLDVESKWIGPIFSMWSIVYCSITPLVGWCCDKKNLSVPGLLFGNLLNSLAFFVIGTFSLLQIFPRSLVPCLVGLCLASVAEAFINIPSVRCMVEGARSQGYPDDVETFGLVSGLYQSAYSLGAFLGPFLGGLLTERTSFPITASIFSGLFMLKALILLLYFGVNRKQAPDGLPPTQKLLS